MLGITNVMITPQLVNVGEAFFVQVTIIHIAYWSDLEQKTWEEISTSTWNQLKS